MGSEYLKTRIKQKHDPLTLLSSRVTERNLKRHVTKKKYSDWLLTILDVRKHYLLCDNDDMDIKEITCVPPITKQISVNYFIHRHFIKKKNLPEVWGYQSIEFLLSKHKTLGWIPSTGEIEIGREYSFKHIIHAKYILIQTKHIK